MSTNPNPYTFVSPGGAEPLASGESIFPRVTLAGGPQLATGQLQLSYWKAATSGLATSVTTNTTGTGAAGLTYAAIGIYSVDSSGNLTLIGSTADLHTTLWLSTFTPYTSTLTTPFPRSAGSRYAAGMLAVGATPPSLTGPPGCNLYSVAPVIAGFATGFATLPATVAAGSITGTFQMGEAIVAP